MTTHQPSDEQELLLPLELPRQVIFPKLGEQITSSRTGNTYTIGHHIGEGNFGYTFRAKDGWNNELAVKVLKPKSDYETINSNATAEFHKLLELNIPV